jgi:hypothetical protein
MKKISVAALMAALSVLLLSGCDPEEQIPSYLSVNSMHVNADYPTQGTSSSNIKDVWVYVDNELLGIYELPARFPVLKEGIHNVLIGAGIYENGISATRTRYPLYRSFSADVDFKPGATVSLPADIEVAYFDINYTWYEDFEGSIFSFDSAAGSKAGFIAANNDDPFEGNFSGKFVLTEANNYFLGECLDSTKDINSFNTAWIELNYKAEQPFEVGLKVKQPDNSIDTEYALTVNRSAAWNKIYINVSDIAGRNSSAKFFKVYITASLESGRSQSVFYIDNLKLIHN